MQKLCRLYIGFYIGVCIGSRGAIKQAIRPRVSLDTIH